MASQPTSDTLLATANAYIQVFTTLDPASFASIQSDKYLHTFAPSSAGGPPPVSAENFGTHLAGLRGVLRSFPVRAKKSWANPSESQVLVWAESETDFHPHVRDNDDEDEWRYRGEYMFLLTMDAKGEKVEHVLEFLDSKATDKLRELMARAWKQKEKVEGKVEGAKGWGAEE